MTKVREDFEKRSGLKRNLEKKNELLGEAPSDRKPLDKALSDKELLDKELFYRELFDREDKERGVKRRSNEMISPEPGELSIELGEMKQVKQERLEDTEDSWKGMEGSGIGMEDSLLSNFFGDKIERLKEDLSHMIQLELEEMKGIKSDDVFEETSTGYVSREEDEVMAALEDYEAMVDMEEAEIILPDIVVEENLFSF